MARRKPSNPKSDSSFRQGVVKTSFWLGVTLTFLMTPQLFAMAGGMASGAFGPSVGQDEVGGFRIVLFLMLCMLSTSIIKAGVTAVSMTVWVSLITRFRFPLGTSSKTERQEHDKP